MLIKKYITCAKKIDLKSACMLLPKPENKITEGAAAVFSSCGQVHRSQKRSGCCPLSSEILERLSEKTEEGHLFRRGNGKASHLSHKQFQTSGSDRGQAVQASMTSGIVFQMDKTASQNQILLWPIPKWGHKYGLPSRCRYSWPSWKRSCGVNIIASIIFYRFSVFEKVTINQRVSGFEQQNKETDNCIQLSLLFKSDQGNRRA